MRPALLFLLGCSILSACRWDTDIANALRRDTSCAPLRTLMQGITLLGDGRTQAGANLAVFFFGGKQDAGNAKLAMVSWTACGLSSFLLRASVNRPRPDNSQTGRWDSSFPSGHVTSYFALTTVYAAKYPKLAIPLYVLGAGVAYSRVYLGKHYPTDVLAGAVLGIGIGWLTLKLEPQLRRIPFLH